MNNENKPNVIDLPANLEAVDPKFIYITIPAEYVCVYHRILAMMADYGEEMLKDCKATCKDRNSGVIECFNMFNAAVAARQLGLGEPNNRYSKLAELLIKYIKNKINQIYKGKDNSTEFVFPIDETGELKAFVSCGNEPVFFINKNNMDLFMHKFNKEFDEHFYLSDEDLTVSNEDVDTYNSINNHTLSATITSARYEMVNGSIRPCADLEVKYDGEVVNINNVSVTYYFDDVAVGRLNNVIKIEPGNHTFTIVVKYKGLTDVATTQARYNET